MDMKIISLLRQQTGAGVLECKAALEEAGGDLDQAVEILRKKGADKAAKKMERETKEGAIGNYIHSNKKIGAMVEVLSETDFVARNEEFQELTHDLAMQVAAQNPLYLRPEDIPDEVLVKEKDIYLEQLADEVKPEMLDKVIEGKIDKYYEDVCLLNQKFIKDDTKTIEDLINEKIAKIGEKIEIRKFCRFEI
ncbi:MAG TPA: translation elongation factor Ts [Patescibacteria group bacterium]